MNEYFKNLNRIEFIITSDCTGHCKHCSQGFHDFSGVHLDGSLAKKVVCELSELYNIQSVMTFGGEPLMYPQSVAEIHRAAKSAGIPKRQLITNGYFSKNMEDIKNVAKIICECEINDILLSADAFHQATIPLDVVKLFAYELKSLDMPVRLNPAWLGSREENNSFNVCTREIINELKSMGIPESDGNVIFPEGNALIYLKDYFKSDREYINPYAESPEDVRSISIEPDGTALGKNIRNLSILEIIDEYEPGKCKI